MLADDFAQASADTIAQNCAADLAGRHKSGAKTVICVAGEHAQHQQFATFNAAVFPDEFKFRTSRYSPVFRKRKIFRLHVIIDPLDDILYGSTASRVGHVMSSEVETSLIISD